MQKGIDGIISVFQHCDAVSSPCPCVFMERLGFELDKSYKETMLQVLTSSVVLLARDNLEVRILKPAHK